MLRLSCPGCKTILQTQTGQAGTIIACPKCRTQLRVPAAAPPPAPAAAAAPKGWYYIQERQKFGPVPLAHLQEMALTGRLQHADMVFQEGRTEWVPAGTVPSLFPNGPAPAVNGTSKPTETAVTGNAPPPDRTAWVSRWLTRAQEQGENLKGLGEKLKDVGEKLKEVAGHLKEAHRWVLYAAGSVPVIIAPVGDFLRPVAPFNGVLFLLSLLASGGLVFLFIKRPRLLGLGLGSVCLVLLLATVGFGAWWGLGAVFGRDNRGFMGTALSPVASLQTAVLTTVTRTDDGVTTHQTVEGDKFAEEVRKQIEAEKDAHKLLQFAFQGYPANVMKAEVVGDPNRRRGTGNEILLEYKLQVGADLEQYENLVGKKILPVLEKVALRRGEVLARANRIEEVYIVRSLYGAFDSDTQAHFTDAKFGQPFRVETDHSGTGFNQAWGEGKFEKEEEMVLVVNTSRNSINDRTTWKWFVVPRTPVFDLERHRSSVRVDISFKKKEGQELNRDQVVLSGSGLPGLYLERGYSNQGDAAIISPYLWAQRDYYCTTATSVQTIRFTQEELQNLGAIRCAVEPIDNPARGSAGRKKVSK